MRFDPPRPKSDDERILPLINVVFLLLIFFVLTGTLSVIDPIEAKPPRSASDGVVEVRELVIVLGADGSLAFDGVLVDKATLKSALAARMAADPLTRVWLKADAETESIEVIAFMELLHDAGVERLKLLTIPIGNGDE